MNETIDKLFLQKKDELLELYEQKKMKKMTGDKDKLDYSVNKTLAAITASAKKK